MARWKQLRSITGTTEAPSGAPDVDTGQMIEAVLSGRPTSGGPGHLAKQIPDRRALSPDGADGAVRPLHPPASGGLGSRVGAVAATAAGKIVLCAAVAAASVGGVYATDAVDRPWVSESAAPAPSTSAGPTIPETMAGPVPTEVVEEQLAGEVVSATPAVAEEPVGSTDIEGLSGCEHGQATAAEASQNASGNRQSPTRDHDPCSASESAQERGQAAGNGEPASPSENAGGGGGGGNPHTEPNGGQGRTNPPGRGGKG